MGYPKLSKRNFIAVNTTQAAKWIGVSEGLLRKFRQNGDGPRYCKIGTKVVYRIQDLDRYVADHIVHQSNHDHE